MSAEVITTLGSESQAESDDEFETQVSMMKLASQPSCRFQIDQLSRHLEKLLRRSAKKNRVDRVRRLIQMIPPSWHAIRVGYLCYEALCIALKEGRPNRDIIRALCGAGACDEAVLEEDQDDLPLADHAVLYGRFDELEELRHFEIDLSRLPEPFRESLLGDACRCGDELIHACFHGDVDMVRKALTGTTVSQEGNAVGLVVMPSEKDTETRKTGLKYAAWRGHREVVQALLAAGVPVDFMNNGESLMSLSPLAYAVCSGHTEVASCLLEAGANPNQEIPWILKADTLLHVAIQTNRTNLLCLLLRFGASTNVTDDKDVGPTALMEAVCNHRAGLEAIDVLLSAGADINEHDILPAWNPLWSACFEGDCHAARKLVLAGVDVNSSLYFEKTALMVASESGSTRCMRELLLSNQVDVNHADKRGYTSLHYCAINNNITGALMLLQAGIDKWKLDCTNKTAAKVNESSTFQCKEVSQVIKFFRPSLQDLCSQRIRRSLPSPITECVVRNCPYLCQSLEC